MLEGLGLDQKNRILSLGLDGDVVDIKAASPPSVVIWKGDDDRRTPIEHHHHHRNHHRHTDH